MKGASRHILAVAALGCCVVAGAGLYGYYYQHFDLPSMTSKPIVSDYNIPEAKLVSRVSKNIHRLEVDVPHHAPLNDGVFLLQLVYGDAKTRMFTRVVYATFGVRSELGGLSPLYGTDGVVLNANDSDFFADAIASIEEDQLVLKVGTDDLDGAELMYAQLFGADNALSDGSASWNFLPSVILYDNLPLGGIILPSIPAPVPPFQCGVPYMMGLNAD